MDLYEEFKKDVTKTMKYIIEIDFSAQPFRMSLPNEIENIIEKWDKKQYSFCDENIERLKKDILNALNELLHYLGPDYMHPIQDGRLLFNNDSTEAGERLRNELQPEIYRIRIKVRDLFRRII